MSEYAVIDLPRSSATYRAETALYMAAVGELLRLAARMPDGLTRVRSFQEQYRDQLMEWEEVLIEGRIDVRGKPSVPMVNFILELRASSESEKGAGE